MGEVLTSKSALLWSIRQAARFTGIARDIISRRIEAAGLAPDGQRIGFPVYRSAALLPVLYHPDRYSVDGDPERLPPRERRDWYEGERVRLAIAVQQRELVTIERYRDELHRVLRPIVDTLETLPDVLERKCGLPPEAITALQRILDEQRSALADRITTESGADDPR